MSKRKSDGEPIIVWGEPPAKPYSGRVSGEIRALIAALRDRPGEWGCVARRPTAKTAQQFRTSLLTKSAAVFARPGRVESVARRTESGDFGIWARRVE